MFRPREHILQKGLKASDQAVKFSLRDSVRIGQPGTGRPIVGNSHAQLGGWRDVEGFAWPQLHDQDRASTRRLQFRARPEFWISSNQIMRVGVVLFDLFDLGSDGALIHGKILRGIKPNAQNRRRKKGF